MRTLRAALVAAAVSAAVPAWADDPPRSEAPPPPAPPPAKVERVWYGWQIAGADLVGGALTFFPGESDGAALASVLGFMVLGGSGPVIHMAHDNNGAAIYSLLRVPALLAGVFLGSVVGAISCPNSDRDCAATARHIGALVGVAGVAWRDYLIAFEEKGPSARKDDLSILRPALAVRPLEGGGMALLGATF